MKHPARRPPSRRGGLKAVAAGKPPPVDIRRERSLATRKKIIDAAITLIATKGLSGATFDAIAKAAKLSPTLPVFHYKSKKALFTDLLHVLSALYTESWNNFVDAPGLAAQERLERLIAHDIRALPASTPRRWPYGSRSGATAAGWEPLPAGEPPRR